MKPPGTYTITVNRLRAESVEAKLTTLTLDAVRRFQCAFPTF